MVRTDRSPNPDHAQNVGTEKLVADTVDAGQDSLQTRRTVEREERDVQPRTRHPTPSNAKRPALGFKFIAPKPEYRPFADALCAAMTRAAITSSGLARAVWGAAKRGAKNRDLIGAYRAGISYPTPENLQKIADVLGVPVETFAVIRDNPGDNPGHNPGPRPGRPSSGDLHVSTVADQPGMMRLQLDRVIPERLALEILAMLMAAQNPHVGEIVGGTDTDKRNNNSTK